MRRAAAAVLAAPALLISGGCGSTGPPHDARVSGRFAVCTAINSPCGPGNGSIYAVDPKHRVVAAGRVNHGRFSLLLLPGRYMLHANQRYGWCHRYDSCDVYRAVLAVAHQRLRVELDVPPPPPDCSKRAYATVERGARTYRDPTGWMIAVPRGWPVARFSSSKGRASSAGAQISNVRLPAPKPTPGFPIQVNGQVLPDRGIGLIIATDNRSGRSGEPQDHAVVPPLPAQGQCGWSVGSSIGGPYLETLRFKGTRRTFIASVKVGPKVPGTDFAAVDRIIRSLRFSSRRR